jgi:hypothetical protein
VRKEKERAVCEKKKEGVCVRVKKKLEVFSLTVRHTQENILLYLLWFSS